MNVQNLMAQAQKVQRDLEKANAEVEASIFEGKNGAVKVEMTGKNEVTKVEIEDDSILNNKELLQDMIMLATNDALNKISKLKEEKLGKYTGGLGGLF